MRRSRPILPWVILLFAHWSALAGQNHPSARGPISVNPQDGLVLEKDTQVAFLVPENISSKRLGDPRLIVASDLLIQDVVIIRRGESALFNLAVDKPKPMAVGAVLTLYVESLRTLVGTDVPVTQRLRFDAGPGCALEGCAFVILAPWIKGPHATISAGTLIGARVAQRLEIPTVEARSASVALIKERQTHGVAQVSVYMPIGENSDSLPHYLLPTSKLKIDGRSAAQLNAGDWACFELSEGDHTLQVDKKRFPLSVARAPTYYLKIERRGKYAEVVQTPGFQLDDETLQFSISTSRAFKTNCW
jgi:hypothetical protein